jgi:G3E family GTPase
LIDAASPPVTVHLLTGFLGSGKTTLLRRILQTPGLADTAVLVNEFGEVGLDHLLLEAVDQDIVLLPSGCLCCTIRGDLKDAVLRLLERKRAGEIPPFERIVIETTGLAEPGPIVATFAADPMLHHQIGLGTVITIVDAVNGLRNLESFEEAVRQVAVADRLIISQTDLADLSAVLALRHRLRALNPTAIVGESSLAAPVSVQGLLAGVADPAARAAEVAHWLSGGTGDHAHEHHHTGIATLALELEPPLDWAAFGLWLGMLLNRHGANVLRAKGILRVADSPTPVVIHGVQHTIHPPMHLEAWPEDRPRTRLVLIVKDLDPSAIERSFRAFMRLGSTMG